jgi:hypothetical protein
MTLLNNSNSMEETNLILKENNLPSYENAFIVTFRLAKKKLFHVTFGGLKSHTQQPYFATSGTQLNHNRSGLSRGGQCQESILSKNTLAYKFYEKWNKLHIKELTMEQYNELVQDMEELKAKYNHIESTYFSEIVKFDREFSK